MNYFKRDQEKDLFFHSVVYLQTRIVGYPIDTGRNVQAIKRPLPYSEKKFRDDEVGSHSKHHKRQANWEKKTIFIPP